MNNKVRNGIIFLVIVALYGGFLLYDTHKPQTGSSPVIKVPKGTLVLDTGMDQTASNQAILEGVKATDKEDGNITKKVFVQGMSTFGEDDVRVVTLGVFDKVALPSASAVKRSRLVMFTASSTVEPANHANDSIDNSASCIVNVAVRP